MFEKALTYAKLTAEQKVNVLLAGIMIYLYMNNVELKGEIKATQQICKEDKKSKDDRFDEYKLEVLKDQINRVNKYDDLWDKWQTLKREKNDNNDSS